MQDYINFLNQHPLQLYALASLLVLLMVIEYFRLKRNNFSIDTTKAVLLINRENATVIDIRAKDSYQKGHILDAHCLSPKEIEATPKKIEKFRSKPILVVCGTGQESQKITALLAKKGYNIYSLSGGLRSWTEAGLPLVKD